VFIDQLHRNFKITTGTFSSFLGMQMEQRQDGIFVCYRVNTGKVLEQFKMHEANPVAAFVTVVVVDQRLQLVGMICGTDYWHHIT